MRAEQLGVARQAWAPALGQGLEHEVLRRSLNWQPVPPEKDLLRHPIRRNPRAAYRVAVLLFLLEVPLTIHSLHVGSAFVDARFKSCLLVYGDTAL